MWNAGSNLTVSNLFQPFSNLLDVAVPHPSQIMPQAYFEPPSPREKVRAFGAKESDKLQFENFPKPGLTSEKVAILLFGGAFI